MGNGSRPVLGGHPKRRDAGVALAGGRADAARVKAIIGVIAIVAALAACKKSDESSGSASTRTVTAANVELKTEDDKALYALGLAAGQSMAPFHLTPAELEVVEAGLTDAVTGAKPKVELAQYQGKLQALYAARMRSSSDKQKAGAKAYVDDAAKEKGAQKTDSGLVYTIEKEGSGAQPTPADTVKVNYEGKLTDGTVFDSSYKRNEPVEFPLAGVIPCWTEGVQKLKVGGKAKLVCPSDIAYGESGHPPTIPGGATLVFEVELLEITTKK
jgi:FKBP-type peptidyl-prolyl cis-trans isomerase FkpA